MPLILKIEHLLGVAFLARGPDRSEPDWPPQPDRVFSALVASWAARGETPAEREALEWLEGQDTPGIVASEHSARPAPLSYVPTNDARSGTKGNKAVLPDARSRQPRRFPAVLPKDPVVRLVWSDAEGAPLAALDAIARDVAYVGHSASLTRCRFSVGDAGGATQPARRRVYPGRLRELEARHRAGQRPPSGQDAVVPPARPAAVPDWLILRLIDEDEGDGKATRAVDEDSQSTARMADEGDHPRARMIDLRAAPIACKAMRDALMCGYRKAGLPIPEWVSGHAPDGAPSTEPHLAVVPLAYAGYEHANGDLHGFGLIPPAGRDLLDDDGFRTAIRALTTCGEKYLDLKLGRFGALRLEPTFETTTKSLRSDRYLKSSTKWATLTPLVLDRHLKPNDGPAEIVAMVERAAVRATGVGATAVVHKHSAVQGAPSATPSGRAPRWTGWTVPERLRSRRLVHATLLFDRPVPGPLLLGAGRFCGLGLCLPLDEKQ